VPVLPAAVYPAGFAFWPVPVSTTICRIFPRVAQVSADTARDALMHQSSYHYIGHFARFLKPGAKRVLCAASRTDLEAAAFVNPDGSVAVVVLNRTEAAVAFALRIGEQTVAAELPARSITTAVSRTA